MKTVLEFLDKLLNVIIAILDMAGLLVLPSCFVVVGLLNNCSWRFYAVTIGGYVFLLIALEIVFKLLDKKYTPFIERKLGKFFDSLFR